MSKLEGAYRNVDVAKSQVAEATSALAEIKTRLRNLAKDYKSEVRAGELDKADAILAEIESLKTKTIHASTLVRIREDELRAAWVEVSANTPKPAPAPEVVPARCLNCSGPRGEKHQDTLCVGDRWETTARAERAAARDAAGVRAPVWCGCGAERHHGSCSEVARSISSGERVSTW